MSNEGHQHQRVVEARQALKDLGVAVQLFAALVGMV